MLERKPLTPDSVSLDDRGWIQSGGPWILLSASLASLCLLLLLCLVLFVIYSAGTGFMPKKIYLWSIDHLINQSESKVDDASTYSISNQIYVQIYSKNQILVEGKLKQRWLLRFTPQQLSAKDPHSYISYPFRDNMREIEQFRPALAPLDVIQLNFSHDEVIYGRILKLEYQDVKGNYNIKLFDEIPFTEQQNIIEEHLGHASASIILLDAAGNQYRKSLGDLKQVSFPNSMGVFDAFYYTIKQISKFLTSSASAIEPDGGIFQAVVGTILLIILTVILVMPFGIITGIYLHEYAQKGWTYRLLRITLVNLAGIPSIIYGMLGLGFFVYILGSHIDHSFYAEQLPKATFGTANLFWGALIMALLTLPVVIMATEEGLSYIPNQLRDASSALGATKIETIWHVLLPESRPAILTGLALAMARTLSEVAPLLLMGAFSLTASNLIDQDFPYIDVKDKFQTLGYYIYALIEQHPYIESAQSLIYAASAFMVLLMVLLNVIVMIMRHQMRHPVSI